MGTSEHNLQTLFSQMGLSSDDEFINAFTELHNPLPRNINLAEANFWTPAQAEFLSDAIQEDSDWCGPVDKLDCLLRAV